MRPARRRVSAVIDTSIFISGIIGRHGLPFGVLEAWRSRKFILVMSHEQREELEEVLSRPRIRDKHRVEVTTIYEVQRLIDEEARRPRLRRRKPVAVRDPKDEVILASALGGHANYLVIGDNDLLVLRDHPRIPKLRIVTAREFLDILASGEPTGENG